jgi:hypothetical protein
MYWILGLGKCETYLLNVLQKHGKQEKETYFVFYSSVMYFLAIPCNIIGIKRLFLKGIIEFSLFFPYGNDKDIVRESLSCLTMMKVMICLRGKMGNLVAFVRNTSGYYNLLILMTNLAMW